MKKKIDWRIVCIGLVCLTVAECFALYLGHNGTMLKIFMVIVGGTIGLTMPQIKTD